MNQRESLFFQAILLLLGWPCVRSNETEKPPGEDIFDQIATASENLGLSYETHNFFSKPTPIPTTASTSRAGTVHYENSNGFIPMTPMVVTPSVSPASLLTNANRSTAEEDRLSIGSPNGTAREILENDPAFSSESRMLLNLGVPDADRRSFDSPDGQNEFEILKVTNETPAIANYHEFYQNVQNKLNQGRGANEGGRYQEADESTGGRTAAQNQRTKERIKKIEKYLTKFHGEPESRNSETHRNYYSFVNGNAKTSSGQSKTTFGQEKVQSNFHQQSAGTNYDVYGESPVNHQRTSPTVRSNYESSGTGSRQSHKSHGSASPKNRHVNSKPVVVVEPSDYKTSVRYGSEQNSPRVSSVDHYRNQKLHSKPDDVESRVNPEDRYGLSYDRNEENVDYSDEADDYSEITEKPKRPHKNRRRPHGLDNSRRLVKEHRGQPSGDDQSEDSRKHNSPTRSKLHRPKAKPSYWHDDDSSDATTSEESSEEHKHSVKTSGSAKPDGGSPKNHASRGNAPTKWSQVGPNIEVSHSSGFEIDQIDKPKLLVPVNINLVPVSGFDHSTALGNSQGFDFTNVPKFVTAAPIVSSPTPLLSTSQSVVTPNIARPTHSSKNVQNAINSNYVLSTAVPDIIVGRNTYQNQIQAVLLPQMNVNKYASNVRASYAPSTVSPMFTVTQAPNQNLQHLNPTVQGVPVQNFHSTVSPRPANSQNVHHVTINPISPTVQPQFVVSQPVIHSFPVNGAYNGHANYNILVNPNGLHGQNLIQHGNRNSPGVTIQTTPSSSTTSQPDSPANNNPSESESQRKKSTGQNSDGHYLATATYAVGNGDKQQKNNNAGDTKYSPDGNERSNNNNYYEHQGNQQIVRSHLPQDFYQLYRQDQDPNAKQYLHPAHEAPTMYQSGHGIPVHFNNQNYPTATGQLQEQQSVLSPTVVAHGPRDQNQQILKAANDIFEQTWKQLQQLQTNEDATRNMPYQHIYRINDNLGSGSNVNTNVANALPGTGNQMQAHLPILGTQNVEIRNPNIKPSPVDFTFVNPYGSVNHYPAAVLTTPIPIFTTVATFLTPRPTILGGTSTESTNLHNYVNTLTQIGAHSNQVNKYETRPDTTNQDNQHSQLYNPIHFVPNADLMRSQSMLNSKITEPLPNQLNLVPVIPGGNFFKNSYGAQSELIQKPRLSNDLAKYAEEMFKESLKTIYSTHKWNNDRRSRGNYTATELSDLIKLNSELQRFKASLPDPNYSSKDVLEAHHSETKIRTAEPSGTTKKPNLSVAAIEQLFKAAVKQNLPPPSDSSHNSHHKNRQKQGHSSSRPGSSTKHRLSNYLTPPKPNSFLSKSPFNDTPKPVKKRPPSRYSSSSNSRPTRPKSASGPEASASSQSGVHASAPHYEKYRPSRYSREKDSHRHFDHSDYRTGQNFENYPTFTTSSSNEEDSFKPSSGELSTKSEYFDINHPRTHNLLGLLMKNKQLPTGTAQSFFRDDDDLRHYFENEKRRMHMQFYDENINNFHKKADGRPLNMAPPAPPNLQQIRYYPG